MATTQPGADVARLRGAPRAARSITLVLTVLLLGPLLAIAAGPASSAAALTPQPIPDALWDAPAPEGATGSYVVVEGAADDPVTQGQDFVFTDPARIGVAFGDDPGNDTELLGLIHDDSHGFAMTVDVPAGETRIRRGYYPNGSRLPAAPGTIGIIVEGFHLDDDDGECGGEITGWVAVDHMREVDGELGELDLRLEQSCDGATPLRMKVHVDVIIESVYGPDPIPDDLWDVTPAGTTGSYVYLEGAAGDPVVGDRNLLLPGAVSTGVVGVPDYPALVVARPTPEGFWTGEFWGHDENVPPLVGFYPNATSLADRSEVDPAFGWWDAIEQELPCADVTGWFAVDHIVWNGDELVELDLRFEQSCDGAPPIHGKVHLDDTPVPPNPRPIPDDLWDEVPQGVTGDYLYIEGAEGDPLTQGEDTLVRYEDYPFAASDYEPGQLAALVRSGPEEGWGLIFDGVDENGLVQPGYYADLSSSTSDDPVLAGIDIRYVREDRDCDGLTSGWFTVDTIGRVDGEIQRLDLRFAQSCDGAPPLHGRIHIDRGGLPAGSPIGELEPFVLRPDGAGVAGWALDPETVAPIDVTYTVDGVSVSTQLADADDPEVAEAYPLYGAAHGISADLSVPMGTHQVCATAKNVGVGSDTVLGCRSVTITSGPPTGAFDVARAVPGGVVVGGWALDPDTSASIPVHVYVGSKGVALTANGNRPDVGAAYPGYGPNHGFNASIQAPPGTHQVCAYAINAGRGPANTFLGCKAVTVPGGSPFGSLDAARGVPGGVVVGGWALDPDTAASIPVHVYAGTKGVALTANGNRPDVGAFFAPYGSAHGFDGFISMPPGAHQVCAYAINVGVGATTTLACRTVVVPGGSPFGSFDVAVGGAGKVTVAGWAIDPDTSASIPVHVYVANVGTALTAANVRNDVAAAFPGYGSGHGFNATFTATPGVKQVCAYGINTGVGGNSLLGCKTVTIT